MARPRIGNSAIYKVSAFRAGPRASIQSAGANHHGPFRRDRKRSMFAGEPRNAVGLYRRGPVVLAVFYDLVVAWIVAGRKADDVG